MTRLRRLLWQAEDLWPRNRARDFRSWLEGYRLWWVGSPVQAPQIPWQIKLQMNVMRKNQLFHMLKEKAERNARIS